ncbi:MAG: putative DNA binding domain-containing protein [Pleurocapsa minor GSE-CHR-MK-17-07R]|jgi:ATP-dependent DNA helicase RecG|nr:putative DNA binding domain-containing protein [Pleurocapsa minor GSE-CHR-MK 17-07R]
MTVSSDELSQLLKQGKSPRLDWFPESAPQDAIALTLTALANSGGGTIVVGILGPAAAVIGVKDARAALDRIVQAALSVEPRLVIPYPDVVKYQDRSLVVATVPRGMPHVYSFEGRFLVRSEYENVPLKPRDLRRLFLERGELSFETEPAAHATLEDIDWSAADAYAEKVSSTGLAGSTENVLIRRGCLTHADGSLRPTHAGILLFGKFPQQFVRTSEITAARFHGEVMEDRLIRQDITGTLPDQLRKAEAFLKDNLRKELQLGRTMARAEAFEVPLEAARELVVNAVAHRDYDQTGDCVHLNLYRDRLEIVSPGGLPGPITVDNMTHERFSRNPIIVQVLSDMGFIERLGYGVDRIIGLMRDRGLHAPVFEDTSVTFKAVLYNQSSERAASPEVESLVVQGTYHGLPVNSRQEAALRMLHNGSTRITNKDLQTLYPDVHAETIRRDLADLVGKNILRKLGEKRGSYYVLKPA